ncbi:MAG: peptidylprolyl isomerase [SAR324 cluster bacterium]|nr:peptidylprolyl isomerase [SAR324 cluster bacterium]
MANPPNPIVTFTLENGSQFKAELYPEQAPNTVNNFISLIQKGYYDGLIFHRVIPGFMIQGGCPDGTGTGGPGYSIRQEFFRDPGDPSSFLAHRPGVLSMARSASPDSAGSQFFVMVADSSHLDRQYSAFGQVTEGLEAVNAMVALPRDGNDRPHDPPRIKSVTVDTGGTDYPDPETL